MNSVPVDSVNLRRALELAAVSPDAELAAMIPTLVEAARAVLAWDRHANAFDMEFWLLELAGEVAAKLDDDSPDDGAAVDANLPPRPRPLQR